MHQDKLLWLPTSCYLQFASDISVRASALLGTGDGESPLKVSSFVQADFISSLCIERYHCTFPCQFSSMPLCHPQS